MKNNKNQVELIQLFKLCFSHRRIDASTGGRGHIPIFFTEDKRAGIVYYTIFANAVLRSYVVQMYDYAIDLSTFNIFPYQAFEHFWYLYVRLCLIPLVQDKLQVRYDYIDDEINTE